MFDKTKIGDSIKDFAFEYKTNPAELAAIAGVEVSNVYRWYKNILYPSLNHIVKIADYFKVSIDYIIGRELINRTFFINILPLFSERLCNLCKSDINKTNLCKAMNISRSQLFYWLKGIRQPTLDSILKLAEYFDFSVDYIIGREN